MSNSRSAVLLLWAVTLALTISGCETAVAAQHLGQRVAASSGLQVNLSSAQRTTSWDVRDPNPVKFALPVLYLHRERAETETLERTLSIQLSGLGPATEVQLEATSYHLDVTSGAPHTRSERIVTPDRVCTVECLVPCAGRSTGQRPVISIRSA